MDEALRADRASVMVGTSGWSYAHWRETFYPPGMPTAKWLEHYVRHFETVEINSTFYRFPSEQAVRRWRALAPVGFSYAVKMSRRVTHLQRLRNIQAVVEAFVRRMAPLGSALGVYLVQLPPRMEPAFDLLDEFLAGLDEAQRAAGDKISPADVAVEVRDRRWLDERLYDTLRRRRASFCIADLVGNEMPLVRTAPLVYVRLHGPAAPYSGSYNDEILRRWAERSAGWAAEGNQVRVYFNNDQSGFAVADALRLREILGGAAQASPAPGRSKATGPRTGGR